jgi:hypothetical protein
MLVVNEQQDKENQFSKSDGDTESKMSFKINKDLINTMTTTTTEANSTKKVNIKISGSQNSLFKRENSMPLKTIIQPDHSSTGTSGTQIQNEVSSIVQDVPSIKFRDVVFAKKFGSSPYDSDR